MTENEFLKRYKGYIYSNYGSQIEAARCYGVSQSFMSGVLQGQRAPTEAMLKDFGYKREKKTTVSYKKES